MSNLKHGFFRRGFMLCDRCVLNGKCESFVPSGQCAVEKQAYDWLYSELVSQYGLEGLVDEVLVGRVAMYLIRAARAEVYEANVGVSDKSVVWGRYIAELDKGLRALLKDLALTRHERIKLGSDDVLVSVDGLLDGLAKRSGVQRRMMRSRSPMCLVFEDWTVERPRLRSMITGDRSDRDAEKERTSKKRS